MESIGRTFSYPVMGRIPVDRPGAVKSLIGLELFNGFMGVASGIALMAAPSGVALGMNTDLLESLSISDFSLVGLFLLTAFGICPLIISWGLITKNDLFLASPLMRISFRHWSWTGALIISSAELAFMCIEVVLIGIFPFTYIWLMMQMLIIVVLNMTCVRLFYSCEDADRKNPIASK